MLTFGNKYIVPISETISKTPRRMPEIYEGLFDKRNHFPFEFFMLCVQCFTVYTNLF